MCPEHLAPFWPIYTQDTALFQRLTKDPLVEKYSIYGFFPHAYELVYNQDPPASISFDGRTRGRVAILRSDTASLVLKPMQSQREDEIARIAGELEIGPRQFPSLPGFLTEEYIEGHFFTDLSPEQTSADSMTRIGRCLGIKLSKLHQQRVYYNDATLADPDGRSHLLVDPNGDCRLIDFGISLLLDQHPNLTGEEVFNYVRTLPEFRLFSGMATSREDIIDFLRQYRQRLALTAPEEIMARDLRFVDEGLQIAADMMGEHIVKPFHQGFHETYQPD